MTGLDNNRKEWPNRTDALESSHTQDGKILHKIGVFPALGTSAIKNVTFWQTNIAMEYHF